MDASWEWDMAAMARLIDWFDDFPGSSGSWCLVAFHKNKEMTWATVDGRNPAPPGMYKTLWIMGYATYQLVQDFFHILIGGIL